MKAVIVKEVEPPASMSVDEFADRGEQVPMMRLEDGQVVQANDCHRFVAIGTEGQAEWDRARNLWRFIEDDSDGV